MVSEEKIVHLLRIGNEVEQTAELLVEAANRAGGKDNISTVVCRW
jgi:serine/threonine protein phosphatase PrpC